MRLSAIPFATALTLASSFCSLVGGAEDAKPELVVHYDLFLSQGSRIDDASGRKHEGTLSGGSIVAGRRRSAVEFDGGGRLEASGQALALDPVGTPLTVGAVCLPRKADGVIAAMGDDRDGFTLYLRSGVPHFAVRIGGRVSDVADAEPLALNLWYHLTGSIDAKGSLRLTVNGNATEGPHAGFLTRRPVGNLSFGGESAGLPGWTGRLQEMRLYRGTLDPKANADELKDWASLSDCGCK
ncbi:LamG-like jellyroll fold domain-containing protein [Aquisphaera insulae]|uniref:LamG-like jellyroll fold domain-containing protein n=1 Tax=Aquisphaera insulae TaxID=2712864 RepID=UPI0013EB1599|nr:LamG-like jellyroll fold domain-containing protein [Aquisphaera insulae]